MPRPILFGSVALLLWAASQTLSTARPTSRWQEPETGQSAQVKSGSQVTQLLAELAQNGVHLDMQRKLIEVNAEVCQDREPLEYLLVAQNGKDHESLLKSNSVSAQALNTAMLLLGAEAGKNVEYKEVDPPPTQEEFEAGASLYEVSPPSGSGFYLYVAWQGTNADGEAEQYFYRAEDLIVNVAGDRPYQRGKWIYLGSRFIRPHKDAEEFFAAEGEGNLISVCYFSPANQLLTGADPEADNQYIWYPNMFLLPEIGTKVQFLISSEKLESAPPTVSSANSPPEQTSK
ncbi:MAG: hypothetical protein HQ519_13550 [Planctomycetes bacterium]|nr:hypothetical protein [Planctomycetota bacterium]